MTVKELIDELKKVKDPEWVNVSMHLCETDQVKDRLEHICEVKITDPDEDNYGQVYLLDHLDNPPDEICY